MGPRTQTTTPHWHLCRPTSAEALDVVMGMRAGGNTSSEEQVC